MEQEIQVKTENIEQNINVTKEDIGFIPFGTKDIEANGVYNVKQFAEVDVNVPGIIPSGTLNITENGTYNVTNYENAEVITPQPSGSINITENGEIDVTNYETANVNVPGISELTDYYQLFYDGHRRSELNPLLSINKNVTNTFNMFYNFAHNSYEEADEINLTNFDTSKVTNSSGMFYNCEYLNIDDVLGLEDLVFTETTNMQNMLFKFGYYASRNHNSSIVIDLSKWHPTKVTTLNSCFRQVYSNFPSGSSRKLHFNLANWGVSNCTDFSNCFNSCKATTIDMTNWDTTKATTMNNMFNSCQFLEEVDLSSFTSESLKESSNMFLNCIRITKIDLRNFSFTGLTTYNNMFGNSSSNFKSDCLIIVKNDTEKNWVTSHFNFLTNVKTVEEYEAM